MIAKLRSLFTRPEPVINITINISSDSLEEAAEKVKAEKVKADVLRIIQEQKRPGGLLR